MVEVDKTDIHKPFSPISYANRIKGGRRRDDNINKSPFKRYLKGKKRDDKKKDRNPPASNPTIPNEKEDNEIYTQMPERMGGDRQGCNREDSSDNRVQRKLIDVRV